jgi:hypothetical protein
MGCSLPAHQGCILEGRKPEWPIQSSWKAGNGGKAWPSRLEIGAATSASCRAVLTRPEVKHVGGGLLAFSKARTWRTWIRSAPKRSA